jgi:hypothetical protein
VKIDDRDQLVTTWDTSNGSLGHELRLSNTFGYESGQYTSTSGASESAPAR